MLLAYLLVIAFAIISPTISQTCPTCPANGIWSPWTSSGTCNTTCGACSTLTRTRTCLSTAIGCPCVGNTTSTAYCNPQACVAAQLNPSIKPCCTSASPRLKGSLFYCVLPDDPYSLACCPSGGYWSNWSDYAKSPNRVEWKRSRTCLSVNHKCPCTGDYESVVSECPCLAPTSLPGTDMTCQNQADRFMTNYQTGSNTITFRPQIIVQPSKCQAYSILEFSNNLGRFNWERSTQVTMMVGNVNETGYCSVGFIIGGSIDLSGSISRIVYNCNLTTLRYEGNGLTDVYKVSQYIRLQ